MPQPVTYDLPPTLPATGGRHDMNDHGYGLTPVISGDMESYNVELVAGAGDAEFAFKFEMRTLVIYAVNAVWVAKDIARLSVVGTGELGDRHFIPAGQRVELPWRHSSVAYKQVAAGGALYIEGRR